MLTALVIVESVSLAASLTVLGIGIYAYRRMSRKLADAQAKAKEARSQMKRFLESCAAALD